VPPPAAPVARPRTHTTEVVIHATHHLSRKAAIAVPAAFVAVLSLTACGGGGGTTTAAGTTAASAPSPARSGPGAFNQEEFAKIRACLAAAGIQLPTPTGRPSGGFRTGPPPSGFPTTRPSGMPAGPRPSGVGPSGRGQGGGFGRMFSDPKVVAALKACGLAVPTRTPGGFRNQSPNPTSTGTA
jgi:hypothetical protein